MYHRNFSSKRVIYNLLKIPADSNLTDLELGKDNDYLVQGNTIQTKAMNINFLKK
jgi:hypothetical protein